MPCGKAIGGRAATDPRKTPGVNDPPSAPAPGDASESDFDVSVVEVGSQVVVAVRGEIDVETAPRVWTCLEEVIPSAEERLVLDLTETTFIDSTALSVFVRAFKRLRHAGADLVLRSPSRTARKIFTITGLDKVMTIED